MDRQRVTNWLSARHRTWRWHPDADDYDRYLAIESTDEGLRYYAWSHLPGEDGLAREERQSFEDFVRHGPRWPAPPHIEAAVRAWLEERRASGA